MRSQQYDEEARPGLVHRIISSQAVKSVFVGLIATVLTWSVVGLNLSTNSGIRINNSVNRYFDTCVGEFFTDTTPRIEVIERGLPLSYVQTVRVPVCNDRNQPNNEVQVSSERYFETGAFIANVLFWSYGAFFVARTYVKRRHIKIKESA